MQTRENALHEWLKTIYPSMSFTLTSLAGDASFRRYYRLQHQLLSQIVMDAPPQKIALKPFVTISEILAEQGIKTPQIHAINYNDGFAILEDFGNVLLEDAINEPKDISGLYEDAVRLLCKMQRTTLKPSQLAGFDQAFMLEELSLFEDWFLKRYLGLSLSQSEHKLLINTFKYLTEQIVQQPQVLIHRDYHSRNIMLLDYPDSGNPIAIGLIDFQDAMLGPITYDLVSLLKDCYINLPLELVSNSLRLFFDTAQISKHCSLPEFHQSFDWCGLQRHLKVLGIFCRLHFRDGKSNYLNDLPLTFHYVMTCAETYQELSAFAEWLNDRVKIPFMSQCK
jgi:aminoglycoside/choline kinase family phosphotransferase